MAKSTSRRVAISAPKIKTAVSLSPEAFRKLSIAGAVESKSQSELVELMISRLLSGYSASVRGPGLGISPVVSPMSVESANGSHDVNLSASQP